MTTLIPPFDTPWSDEGVIYRDYGSIGQEVLASLWLAPVAMTLKPVVPGGSHD